MPPAGRLDVNIPAKDGLLMAGWLYKRPTSSSSMLQPAMVLGHGLGAIKEMRLDAYAERFQAEGYTVVVFDYRHFGGSQGTPRQLLDIEKQNQDWHSVISYARALEGVDPDRVGIFGSSFGGGHVIRVAAEDPRIAASIAQCPFTDGFASALTLSPRTMIPAAYRGLRDILLGGPKQDDGIVKIMLAGEPNEVALMNAPGAMDAVRTLLTESNLTEDDMTNWVAARVAIWIPFARPGRSASKVSTPIYFAICGADSVAPPGPSLYWAKQAPRGTVKLYEGVEHFSVYYGENFKRMIEDYVKFLKQHLPVVEVYAKL